LEALDAYKVYLGMRLHFQSDTYDYVKYNGAVRCSKESFLKRNDRYFFHKLSKRYNTKTEFEHFLVSNFAVEDNVNPKWLTQKTADANYNNWTKNQQMISRLFEQDLKMCLDNTDTFGKLFLSESKKHPPIVKMILRKEVSIESAIILDHFLRWIEYVNKEVDDLWVWPKICKTLLKCKPFIKFNEAKCRITLKRQVENVNQKI